jgi:hypothetical protein
VPALPVAKFAHVPFDGAPAAMEQASQLPPLHAALQQTPSTQKPEEHCAALAHTAPFVWSAAQ